MLPVQRILSRLLEDDDDDIIGAEGLLPDPQSDALESFLSGAKIDPVTADYLRRVLRVAITEISSKFSEASPLGNWFNYHPKSRDDGHASVEFYWDTPGFNPDIAWAASYGAAYRDDVSRLKRTGDDQVKLVKEINKVLSEIPKPSMCIRCMAGSGNDSELLVKVWFRDNIFDDVWEEGSAGYKD
jgi:hypothetical protein